MRLNSTYGVVDDKLVPEDLLPLVLSGKLKEKNAKPVVCSLEYHSTASWEIPEKLAEREKISCPGRITVRAIRDMIRKMAAVNGVKDGFFYVSIYEGCPEILVIEQTG